jgi:hypothetical protein
MKLKLSTLRKTWIIDIDGTVFIHNGYLDGRDTLVPGFRSFYRQIDPNDYILLVTSREKKYKPQTLKSLKKFQIRFDNILFDIPKGERILINDIKPRGLQTGLLVLNKRDKFPRVKIMVDDEL